MLRILVADDHAVVRRGVSQILSDTPDMVVAGEAANGEEVLRLVQSGHWDAVLLDITMPGRSGLDILGELKQRWPDTPVLVLSMHPEDQIALRVLKAGAAGYMTKESAPDVLVGAIRKVVSGGRYVSPELAEYLVTQMDQRSTGAIHDTLSDREYQVLCQIASGEPVSEIARELSLSVKTVSTYRRRVLDKMHLRTNADLMRYAIDENIVH